MIKNISGIIASVFITALAGKASAQDFLAILSVDGKPGLALRVPEAAKVTSTNGYLGIQATNLSLYIWAVPNAKTVDDAVPRAAELIKSEFVKFQTNTVKDISIAGAPAKHVMGSGNEADDGDPGNAEVVFFVVGGHVFAACVHGEADDASKARPAMMAMLKTVQSPT